PISQEGTPPCAGTCSQHAWGSRSSYGPVVCTSPQCHVPRSPPASLTGLCARTASMPQGHRLEGSVRPDHAMGDHCQGNGTRHAAVRGEDTAHRSRRHYALLIMERTHIMNPCSSTVSVVIIALGVLVAAVGRADDGAERAQRPNRYVVTTLTADLPN